MPLQEAIDGRADEIALVAPHLAGEGLESLAFLAGEIDLCSVNRPTADVYTIHQTFAGCQEPWRGIAIHSVKQVHFSSAGAVVRRMDHCPMNALPYSSHGNHAGDLAGVQLFLSTVSDEFRSYRDHLRHALDRPEVTVKVQEDFIVSGTPTLEMLDDYIRHRDGVIHLVGDMTGSPARAQSLAATQERYPDLSEKLKPIAECLQPGGTPLSYTQWEAWLALLHGRRRSLTGGSLRGQSMPPSSCGIRPGGRRDRASCCSWPMRPSPPWPS
jgi:hypothetical protein